ncbi:MULTISPECIES: hypothetical protein [unclassified Methylobacterium]|uniref:hypothetical protein n=1 Tax=unclassified Methylobacterium TaxID=2615210 RepID=UPI0011C2042A|nr:MULTISPECIES: hypothetical protein [unclassified Methylobacterium]QEE41817.1 hypothetical protein FVA80_25670 [Methylobacterium sp. WL1]TXN54689.1 hypothetical protein FV241_23065 [Methylobacterium sp. WL2]
MREMPTPKQALILWCLLGRCGSALQSTLAPRIDKADREALIAGRYLEAERQGRSLRLTVTDKGWNWAGEHMREPLPPTFRVLQDWLERIHVDLARTGRPLADLVGSAPDEPAPAAPAPRASRSTAEGPQKRGPKKLGPKQLGPKQLRARIDAAYLALTGGARAKAVRLSALRAHLEDLDRATVDAGLAAILRNDRTARLSQFSDPKSLNAAEREAAFSPAGEPFHILWIQS